MVVDLDKRRSDEQQKLVYRFYRGYIPHIAVIDKNDNALYNRSGEEEEETFVRILDKALAEGTASPAPAK